VVTLYVSSKENTHTKTTVIMAMIKVKCRNLLELILLATCPS